MSLIGGFSAPKITKVLEQSGYLVAPPKLAMKRLFDTGAQHATIHGSADNWGQPAARQ